LPKKFFQNGGYFQNGVCTFFLHENHENMSCDRFFKSIVLIFGLSHYFLTFNQTKIKFRFVDHPSMGQPHFRVANCGKRQIEVVRGFQVKRYLPQ
jgi:hypothetical protein